MGVLNGGLLGSSGGGGGGGGLSNVVDDGSPGLGGDLDVLAQKLVSSIGDVELDASSVAGSDIKNTLSSTGKCIINFDGDTGVDNIELYLSGVNQRIEGSSARNLEIRGGAALKLVNGGVDRVVISNSTCTFHQKLGATAEQDIGTTGADFGNLFLADSVIMKSSAGDPGTVTDSAHVYTKDVSTVSEVFVRDEGGTVTQISEHSRSAPDFMYDDEDDIIDRMGFEMQYFQGFVRFTNKTRMGLLTEMTDAEKSALTAQKRQCVYQESFTDYNTRTGESLVQLDWDTEQTRLQAEYDAERDSVLAVIAVYVAEATRLEDLKVGIEDADIIANLDEQIDSIDAEIVQTNLHLQEDKDIKKAKPSWLV